MRTRQLVACLSAFCLAFPALAAPANPVVVGLTVSTHSAVLGNAGLRAGATVFNGDRLRVERGGNVLIATARQSTLNFDAESSATLSRAAEPAPVVVELHSGLLSFHAQGRDWVEVLLADAVIRNAGSAPAKGIVARVTLERAVIGAESGEITVSTAHDGRSVTLRAGETVEVLLPEKTATPPQAVEPAAKGRSGKRTALIGVIVAGGITALLLMASSGLTRGQHMDLVSPFKLP